MKKCQVPGCENTAENFRKNNKIYLGVYFNNEFAHCDIHTEEEISAAEAEHHSNEVVATQKINPFLSCIRKVRNIFCPDSSKNCRKPSDEHNIN